MGLGTAAVVVAAGSGRRMGGTPKQFRPLGDRPLLAWSCDLFAAHPEVDRLVVVVPTEQASSPPSWLAGRDAVLVAGGETRRASVELGLAEIGEVEIVLVHDAARPFASAVLVSRLVDECRRHSAAIPVLCLSDAIKRVEQADGVEFVQGTVDRSLLRAAQTPQAFRAEKLRQLHLRGSDGPGQVPDDAALFEAAGHSVRTIAGERMAFKITHPEDFEFAEWLVATGRVRPAGTS